MNPTISASPQKNPPSQHSEPARPLSPNLSTSATSGVDGSQPLRDAQPLYRSYTLPASISSQKPVRGRPSFSRLFSSAQSKSTGQRLPKRKLLCIICFAAHYLTQLDLNPILILSCPFAISCLSYLRQSWHSSRLWTQNLRRSKASTSLERGK